MNVNQTITLARQHLARGNRGAYERIMSAALRRASSDRVAQIIRNALSEDLGVAA
ncbi:MAG: hypothetical protein V4712_17590 [Pseudomonadota bacterium]